MSIRAKLFSLAVIFSLALAAVPASATLVYCPNSGAVTETDYGTGATVIRLAVAANFAGPFGSLLSSHYATSTTYTVAMCSDSTGNFETLINNAIANNTAMPYDMLFAADDSASAYEDSVPGTVAYRYAIGVPVLFGYTSTSKAYYISSLSDLLTTNDSTNFPVSSNITATPTNLSHYTLSSTITSPNGTTVPQPSLAIADPSKAPYGLKGELILNSSHPVLGSGYTLPSGASNWTTWLKPLATYANIGNTFNAVGASGGVAVGVVGKSQICSLLSGVVYVEFSDTNFQLNQYVASFTSNNVNDYISAPSTGLMATGAWSTFLSGACYLGY